ncbi:aminotransferase class V-fold PLP-dependent enzyme [Streptomyces sp. DG1A-41]|uniref:aminotransferase class V-fold PLP-dependent enzyme n=1 Tax=Streptomyces sp. DG1A-41 TaxID=3125779 RepID=UPI0030CE2E40
MTGSGVPAHPGFAGGPVYLDHNATPPVDPRVAESMLPHLTDFFGAPSSSHPYSAEPRQALAAARAWIAALIGARAEEIVFTASGSEADLLARRHLPPGKEARGPTAVHPRPALAQAAGAADPCVRRHGRLAGPSRSQCASQPRSRSRGRRRWPGRTG